MKRPGIIILLVFALMIITCDDKKAVSNKPVIVCFGNSLTIGHGASIPKEDDPENSYPSFLQKKINIPVINAGVTGDTTGEALARVNNHVLSKNPQVVIIELGANDLFQMILPSITQNNLQKITDLLNDGSRKIYIAKFYTEEIARDLLSEIESDYDKQTAIIKIYDTMFETLSESGNVELIEDIWAGVWGIHMSDTIHPNAKGYEIMADNYFNALLPYLKANGLLK